MFETLWRIFHFTQWCRLIILTSVWKIVRFCDVSISLALIRFSNGPVAHLMESVALSYLRYSLHRRRLKCFRRISFLMPGFFIIILLLMSQIGRCTKRLKRPISHNTWSLILHLIFDSTQMYLSFNFVLSFWQQPLFMLLLKLFHFWSPFR